MDDEFHFLEGLRRRLRPYRREWEIVFVQNGKEALGEMQKAAFDAVVLDLYMPGMNGFDLLGAILEDERTKDIPVIVLTGGKDQDLKRRALDLGATDLLGKPVELEDLLARLRSVLRLKAYQDEIKAMNAELEQRIEEHTRYLMQARVIQSLSLQEELPVDDHIVFTTHYIPHDLIGGDYYAIAQLDIGCYGFFLADITGHGIPAALYTMHLRSLWNQNRHLIVSPSVFAEVMNDSLCRLIEGGGHFAAAICGMFDLRQETLTLCSAGNPPPLVIHSNDEFEHVNCAGLPLGCIEGTSYEETVVETRAGDCVLLFTDGAVEIRHAAGEYLNADGLVEILRELGYPRSDAGFQDIEDQLLKYSNQIGFDDDLTFIEARLT